MKTIQQKENSRLREIRIQLRRLMNGVVSNSMRKNGIVYKLNFGVSIADLRKLTASYNKEAALADEMWKKDVREMKLLATMLYPLEEFTQEIATRWIADLQHKEVTEQLAMNLLSKVDYAESLATQLILSDKEFSRVAGYLTFAYRFTRQIASEAMNESLIIERAKQEMQLSRSRTSVTALLALKRLGRMSKQNSEQILEQLSEFKGSNNSVLSEFYEDLSFEFEYFYNT